MVLQLHNPSSISLLLYYYLVLKIVVKMYYIAVVLFELLLLTFVPVLTKLMFLFIWTLPITMSKKYYHPGSKLTRLKFFCCCWCPYLQQSCENFCIHLDRWMILVKKENVKKLIFAKKEKSLFILATNIID